MKKKPTQFANGKMDPRTAQALGQEYVKADAGKSRIRKAPRIGRRPKKILWPEGK